MLPRVKKTYVDGHYGQLHCRMASPRETAGAPVVCLHMSPKSGRSYHEVLPWLANERLALAPDYPGHGESDLPPAEPHVTVADYAADIWRVVDALAGTPVHLVGYHTGAMVAVEATVQRPDDVLSIVSVSAPIFTSQEARELDGLYSPIELDEDGSRFRIMWERVMQHRGPGMTLDMAAASFAENLRAGSSYEWGHRAAFAYANSYRQNLAQVELPVFVLNPADDCHEQSKRADELLKNGHRRDYPEWGHGFLNAYPQTAADAILDFIRKYDRHD